MATCDTQGILRTYIHNKTTYLIIGQGTKYSVHAFANHTHFRSGTSVMDRPQSVVSSFSHHTPNSNRSSPVSSHQQQLQIDHRQPNASSSRPYQHRDEKRSSIKSSSPSPSPAAGRFTEEWDASQRGSSIIQGSARDTRAVAMQRSSSVHSFAAGDDEQLPVKNNTLKKKASMRRASSLHRSSSRRSNRAGSVRSLALHSASDPDKASSVFYCPVPTTGTPTDVLSNRFQSTPLPPPPFSPPASPTAASARCAQSELMTMPM